MRISRIILLSIGLALFTACGKDGGQSNPDNFDRSAVIENTVDHLILPSYGDLIDEMMALESAFSTYKDETTASNKEALKTAWLNAYLAWQDAALWNFGPAESQGLMTAMNIYPTDTTQIVSNINGTYDLNSIAQIDAQGFPALEYMLFGNFDLTQANALLYFEAVVMRMKDKALNTANQWASVKNDFINSTGTDQGSALGQLFNSTFLPYLEVHQREAKFGIPGGQRTGQPDPSKVECRYARTYSKQLALRAFQAYRRAWLGMSHTDHNAGPSVMDYVAYMDNRNGTSLETKLQDQLDGIELAIDGLDDDFYVIAQSNPQLLNDVWAQYQLMVFTIKTEISSALNVTISYVDSDGD
ncbi:MAG: hypothetical protein EP346_04385 [Bacteroidetes bacterium]|nr:MAG: hypothetical protein EP346_04385 [Bacteroidota bacterium]